METYSDSNVTCLQDNSDTEIAKHFDEFKYLEELKQDAELINI